MTDDDNHRGAQEAWSLAAADPYSPRLSQWLDVHTSQLDTLEHDRNDLREQLFIDTATGQELVQLARPLGAEPRQGESDEAYRLRVRGTRVARTSTGSIEDIARLLDVVFGSDASQVRVGTLVDEPTVIVDVPDKLFDDYPIDIETLEELVDEATPATDDARVQTDALFAFDGSDETAAGFGVGKWYSSGE